MYIDKVAASMHEKRDHKSLCPAATYDITYSRKLPQRATKFPSEIERYYHYTHHQHQTVRRIDANT